MPLYEYDVTLAATVQIVADTKAAADAKLLLFLNQRAHNFRDAPFLDAENEFRGDGTDPDISIHPEIAVNTNHKERS